MSARVFGAVAAFLCATSTAGLTSTTDADVLRRVASARWANTKARFNISRPVDPAVVQDLLHVARTAPSSFNAQPWVCVVVQGAAPRRALAQAMLGANRLKIERAPLTVVFAADLESSRLIAKLANLTSRVSVHGATPSPRSLRMMSVYLRLFASGHRLPFLRPLVFLAKKVAFGVVSRFLPAPTVSSAECWATKNTMLAAQNLLLAATAHGLASCPMEGFDGRRVRRALGIPRRFSVPLVVAIGHAEDGIDAIDTARYPREDIFFADTFGVPYMRDAR